MCIKIHMWSALPKNTILMSTNIEAQFHVFSVDKPINKSLKGLGWPAIHHSVLFWLLSDTFFQMSVSAWVVFEWLYLAWTSRQLNGVTTWLASIISQWSHYIVWYVEFKTASIYTIWLRFSLKWAVAHNSMAPAIPILYPMCVLVV